MQPGVARLCNGNRFDQAIANQHGQPKCRRYRKPDQETDRRRPAPVRSRFSANHLHHATIREWQPVRIRPDA